MPCDGEIQPHSNEEKRRHEKTYSKVVVEVLVVSLKAILGVSGIRRVVSLPVNFHKAQGDDHQC